MAREISMPRLSDSMEEGTILKWLVALGDEVGEDQPLVEVETDKAVVTYDADTAGTVLALHAAAGDTVAVGAPLLVIGAAHERGAAEETGAAAEPSAVHVHARPVAAGAVAVSAPPAAAPRVKASPLARRLAQRLSVDLGAIRGSGPHGRVIRADVERHAASATPAPVPAAAATANGSPAHVEASQPATTGGATARGQTARVEPSSLQRTVARRMTESRATVPDIELRVEADMSRAVAMRAELRALAGADAPSLNDLIVKASALALREFPRVNGAFADGAHESYSRVNVGIAVAAPDGLLVPTVFDADQLSLGRLASESRRLATAARERRLTPAELGGATFTVSNLGMFGIDGFSAIINPPQAAILTAGAVRKRPLVLDSGELAARDTVQLALACDHRILDGVDGARFLARVRELLEQPLALVL